MIGYNELKIRKLGFTVKIVHNYFFLYHDYKFGDGNYCRENSLVVVSSMFCDRNTRSPHTLTLEMAHLCKKGNCLKETL